MAAHTEFNDSNDYEPINRDDIEEGDIITVTGEHGVYAFDCKVTHVSTGFGIG